MKKQCYDQVEDLVASNGKIDILWYDGGWLAHKGSDTSSSWFWEPVKLNKMARKYNPKMIMNPDPDGKATSIVTKVPMRLQEKSFRYPGKKICVYAAAAPGAGWQMTRYPILTG